MTHKTTTILGLTVIFLSAYLLFSMKREVETLSFELSEIQKQINTEKGKISLLKAQYVYLTSPARIRKLAEKYLNLSTITPEQMMPDPITHITHVASLENKEEKGNLESYKMQINSNHIKTIRWRYKHMSNKYTQRTALGKK